MNRRRFYTTLFLGLFVLYLPGLILALDDQLPPKLEKTQPIDGTLDVFPVLMIHAWLTDPATSSFESPSGVDLDSIQLWIDDQEISLTVQTIGDNRVWAHTSDVLELDENSWIFATFLAKDYAGNEMEPSVIRFRTTARPDQNPPSIDHLSPPDQSTGNEPLSLVSCWLRDEISGLDFDTILCKVNSEQVPFTYAVIEDGIQLFHLPQNPFEVDDWVAVEISVSDLSGNVALKSWTFKIQPSPPEPPDLFHPADGALLNYQLEAGRIRFIWNVAENTSFYRLRIKPRDGLITDIIDLSSGDCWVAGNLVGYNFLLSFERWYQFSCRDSLMWSIAVIDGYGGSLLSEFSEWSSVILAPPNAVVIRTPVNGTVFSSFDPCPLFTWDSFDDAESYLFGIAKFDSSSGLFQNMLTLYVESEVTSLRLPAISWKSLGPGQFIWAVIAKDIKGNYSDFMNYQFSRYAPIIISEPLTFD
ncbi:hypothetical protein JW823_03405 [bacterium]|nr:hypothetical protein [candidate division CSSED10-310 bacterium]